MKLSGAGGGRMRHVTKLLNEPPCISVRESERVRNQRGRRRLHTRKFRLARGCYTFLDKRICCGLNGLFEVAMANSRNDRV